MRTSFGQLSLAEPGNFIIRRSQKGETQKEENFIRVHYAGKGKQSRADIWLGAPRLASECLESERGIAKSRARARGRRAAIKRARVSKTRKRLGFARYQSRGESLRRVTFARACLFQFRSTVTLDRYDVSLEGVRELSTRSVTQSLLPFIISCIAQTLNVQC